MITDTERLDFVEQYLEREAQVQTKDGHMEPVKAWSIVTGAGGTLRETIDHFISQKGRMQNG